MLKNWTPEHIPSLEGKVAIVTGGNSGVGYYTALELAKKGARVIIGSRDRKRGQAAIVNMRKVAPGIDVSVEPLNLADLNSVRSFAAAVIANTKGIDILVNNAGVMAVRTRELTADGFEMHFGTNHLGHFALTGLLFPLVQAVGGRIVTVSAQSARIGDIDFSDLRMDRRYGPMKGYNRSKLANLLFAQELNRRAKQSGVASIAVHPGTSPTGIGRNTPAGAKPIGLLLMKIFGTSPERSAWPSLIAAIDPTIAGEQYIGLGMNPIRAKDLIVASFPKKATDTALAAKLWSVSAKLTNVEYPV